MIHHVSIPARDPQHVAAILAEVMGGKSFAFGPLEGAFMATSGDEHGTMIEVYPDDVTLDIPKNDDQVVFGEQPTPRAWPFHLFLSVARERAEVEAIGRREGWRAKTFGRGMQGHEPFFHVIEFWIENRLMVEVATPEMTREYLDFLSSSRTRVMSDPESLRLMRATHKETAAS